MKWGTWGKGNCIVVRARWSRPRGWNHTAQCTVYTLALLPLQIFGLESREGCRQLRESMVPFDSLLPLPPPLLAMIDSPPPSPTLRQNPTNQPWIVMKYGGTSVGKFLETIASDIVPCVGAFPRAGGGAHAFCAGPTLTLANGSPSFARRDLANPSPPAPPTSSFVQPSKLFALDPLSCPPPSPISHLLPSPRAPPLPTASTPSRRKSSKDQAAPPTSSTVPLSGLGTLPPRAQGVGEQACRGACLV